VDESTLSQAEEILRWRFQDRGLLARALTHASIAETRQSSNERLEFLGDAVLGMLVCEHVFRAFPDLLEGDMTKIKSAVVSRRTCAIVADRLGLSTLLRLGKGMQVREGLPSSVSAAVLESVIGAVYLEGGLEATRAFLMAELEPIVARAAESGHQQNFKSVLQQVAQQHLQASPVYVVLDERGPDHAKTFEVCVDVGGRRFASAWGGSKKQAEQQAALHALKSMGVVVMNGDGDPTVISADAIAEIVVLEDSGASSNEA